MNTNDIKTIVFSISVYALLSNSFKQSCSDRNDWHLWQIYFEIFTDITKMWNVLDFLYTS